MGLFTKKVIKKIPPECEGMEIRIQSSTCTGEKTIGFYSRSTRELMYTELVRDQSDIDGFYEKYGIAKPEKK
ncbi:MAG: hypothetical protein J5994_02610 [Ruminococcus sp.]|nr:hypothetical protein [Ruminococcus sp.]